MRTELISNTTFYIATNGSDSTGDGSQQNPFATGQHVVNLLKDYDLKGYDVTVQYADGTYDDHILVSGKFVGQASPFSLTFQGNLNNKRSVTIRPSIGNAFAGNFGAQFHVRDMTLDMSDFRGDTIAISSCAIVWIRNIVFGFNLNPYQLVSASFGAHVFMLGNFEIDTTTFETTGTFSPGSNTITVADISGFHDQMMVIANGIPCPCVAFQHTGNVVTLNAYPTSSGTNVPVKFVSGANSAVYCSNQSTIYNMTDGESGVISFTFNGTPGLYQGFAFAWFGEVNFPACQWTGSFYGQRYNGFLNGVLNVNQTGEYYFPGTHQGRLERGAQYW